jgi:hypothetical protein
MLRETLLPLYTFFLRTRTGASTTFETYELETDGAAFEQADVILARHDTADHVEVWDQDRAVVARHCEHPIIPPVIASEP